MLRRLLACLLTGTLLALAGPAHAYRPFDDTDAAVPDPGEFEIELGPLQYLHGPDSAGSVLEAPDAVLNLGVLHGWELSAQARDLFVVNNGVHTGPRFRVVDTGLFAKGVLREGSLQGHRGPSIAIELGALLPTYGEGGGVGPSATLLVSQRTGPLTLHENLEAFRTRDGSYGGIEGLIIEGPLGWTVRPVADVYGAYAWRGDTTVSALGGLIWRVRDNVALDLAARVARQNADSLFEVRAGLTWTFSLVPHHHAHLPPYAPIAPNDIFAGGPPAPAR